MVLAIMAKHRLNLFDSRSVKHRPSFKAVPSDAEPPQPRNAKPERTATIRADLLPDVVQAELSTGQIAYRRHNGDWRARYSDKNGGTYGPVGKKWRRVCESAYQRALKDGA